MATTYWTGKASAVAQVSEAQLTGYTVSETYSVVIGGVSVSTTGVTDANTTVDNLITALNASTHPYFAAITWAEGTSTDYVEGTADQAGEPFTFTVTATGAGTWGAVSDTTANVSPNDWDDDDNWSGSKPASTDTVIVKNSSVPILWGLDQSAVDLTAFTIEKSFTGQIGLRPDAFYTGGAADTTAPEYRSIYLDIGADDIDIGEHNGPGDPAGSTRINIDNDKAGASELRIHDTADAGEASNPAVAYLAAHANADVEVRSAPGGVGLTTLVPAETATYGDIDIPADNSTTRVYVGPGATITNYTQNQGDNELNPAADVTAVTIAGGELLIDGGDYTITTMTMNAGTVDDRHADTGAVIGTLNMNDGTLSFTGSAAARTVTTCNFKGGQIVLDDDVITISSGFIGTAGGIRTVTVEAE